MKEINLALVQEQGVVNGFSYLFTKGLVLKLEELQKTDRLFYKGSHNETRTTEVGEVVIAYLMDQMRMNTIGRDSEGIKSLLATAEEFLAIFE